MRCNYTMLDRADLVLAAIPLLAGGGFALRTVVVASGVATGPFAASLGPAGTLAAFGLIVRELVSGPVARRSAADDSDP